MNVYELHRPWLRAFYSLAMRPHIYHAERMPRTGGVVVVSNHLTMVDPFLLPIFFPRMFHFMAKEELFRPRPVSWYLRNVGAFPVRRGEVDRASLKQAEELLKSGEVLLIFPEGHRSEDAAAQAAHTGAILLASRAEVPILPMAIMGTERLSLRAPWRRPSVEVHVGEPYMLDATARGRGRRIAADTLMRRIVAMLPPSYHGVYAGEHAFASQDTQAG